MKNIYTSNEWAALKTRAKAWKDSGYKLVFTNGCFDILHPGHEALLSFVHEQDGKSILGLNSDESVRRLKGHDRPVNTAEVRARNVLKTGLIDVVVIYNEDTPQELTDLIEPDILIKGDDYSLDTTVGAPEVQARGGTVLFFKRIPNHSTTKILNNDKKNTETIKK
jgi:rfaE bifunctional protein nucleotidyltransferase chain/domain